MSNAKFTPGEWRILEVDGRRWVAAVPYDGHPYHRRTRFFDICGDEDYPTKDADLALVAAAPEMYAALKAALKRNCGCCDSRMEDWHSENCAVPKMRAALTKASGPEGRPG